MAGVADEPLPLPVYARALALLISQRDQPVENVLGALGVTMEQLRSADAHYSEQLRSAYRKRRGILAMTFAEAFAEARIERGLLGASAPPAPVHVHAPAAPPPAEAHALPSYMSATPSPAAAAAPSMAPYSPAPPAAVAALPVPPAAVASAPPAMVASSPPAMAASPPSSALPVPPAAAGSAPPAPATSRSAVPQGTADFQLQHVMPQAVPFKASAGAAAVPAQPVSRPAAPAASGPGTGTVLAPSEGGRGAELPWDAAQVRERVGKLTLAHFAALTIEVGRNPPDLGPVLRRYGLSSQDDLRHVSAAFHAQMSVDATMKAQFDALLSRMRSMSARRDG